MLDERPDGATVDDATKQRLAFADQAEALLRAILSTLGYTHEVSLADLIAGIGAWLAMVKLMTRDPDGRVASIWWKAYDGALARCPLMADDARRVWAEEEADHAAQAFLRRFPPLLEDAPSRDTVDDLEALRAELDRQTQLASEALETVARSTYRAHSAEVALRTFAADLQAAMGARDGDDLLAIARDNTRDARGRDIAERELAELRASAIVPLPKPERVEPGQRWAYIQTIRKLDRDDALIGEDWREVKYMSGPDYAYFGNAPTSEAK